jgi:hypothetical protein
VACTLRDDVRVLGELLVRSVSGMRMGSRWAFCLALVFGLGTGAGFAPGASAAGPVREDCVPPPTAPVVALGPLATRPA